MFSNKQSLDMINPVAAEIEESNALALAIGQPGDNSKRTVSSDLVGDSGRELALITAPSNSTGQVIESKMVNAEKLPELLDFTRILLA